jgi:hypothetical protein
VNPKLLQAAASFVFVKGDELLSNFLVTLGCYWFP